MAKLTESTKGLGQKSGRGLPWRLLILTVVLGLALLSSPGFSAKKEAKAPAKPPSKAAKAAPEAKKILRQACDFLKAAKQFSFQAEVTDDQVYTQGKKLQFALDLDAYVSRPDKLRVNAAGDLENKQFFDDGKTITLYDKPQNVYATMKAPGAIAAALNKAHREYGLRVALADLTSGDAYALMTKGVKHALYVGEGLVRGEKCHHLAFDKKKIQFQIWISLGAKPLIRKVLITQKEFPASPQWTAYLTDWNFSPKFSNDLFVFKAPPGAAKIKFISVKEEAAARKKEMKERQKEQKKMKKQEKKKGDKS